MEKQMLNNIYFLIICSLFVACVPKSEVKTKTAKTTPLLVAPIKDKFIIKSGAVKRGEGLYQALKKVSINNAQSLELINLLRDEVEFSKLKVGDKFEATFTSSHELIKFSFSQNPAEKHILKKDQNKKWVYKFKEEKTFWHSRLIEGRLKAGSNLQDDLIALGLKRSVVAEVVNVLLCKVNFRFNARENDKYTVLLKERKLGKTLIETKVLYTSYKGKKAKFSEAFFYEDSEKGSTYTAHYTKNGEILVRSGLRYPLKRLHIRSGYGFRRHPVTGKRAMHRGIDLRGRRGTPVYAVAAGTVILSSYDIFAGNKIAVKHRDGSESFYLHLHSKNVKRGQWVRPGQIIGTVGSTGRVTGPHLHYGFKRSNGRWMNPLNKRMIATPKLRGERYNKLQEQIAKVTGLVQDIRISKVSQYLVARIPNKKKLFESIFNI